MVSCHLDTATYMYYVKSFTNNNNDMSMQSKWVWIRDRMCLKIRIFFTKMEMLWSVVLSVGWLPGSLRRMNLVFVWTEGVCKAFRIWKIWCIFMIFCGSLRWSLSCVGAMRVCLGKMFSFFLVLCNMSLALYLYMEVVNGNGKKQPLIRLWR